MLNSLIYYLFAIKCSCVSYFSVAITINTVQVAYDVEPLAVADLLKKIVAAHVKRHPDRYA